MRRPLRAFLTRLGLAEVADSLRGATASAERHYRSWRLSVLLPVGTLIALTATDLALLSTRRPVMALFLVVPVLGLLGAPNSVRCARLGVVTLLVTSVLGVLHWPDRPVVVVTVLIGVAVVTWIAWAAARSFQRQTQVLGDVRTVAEAMQRAVLDPLPRQIGPLRLEARYLAAAAEARVGGDFYAALSTRFGVRLILGDVCGHGMPAVQTAADAVATFRDLAYLEPTLAGIALRMNLALRHPNRDRPFVAALLVEIPHGCTTATILCCGHAPPLLIRGGKAFHLDLRPHCLPLGLLQLQSAPCVAHPVELAPGDSLLLSTDGVTEARDARNRFYPLAERATALYRADPAGFLDALQADLLRHTDGQGSDNGVKTGRLHDDAVLLLARFDAAVHQDRRPDPDVHEHATGL